MYSGLLEAPVELGRFVRVTADAAETRVSNVVGTLSLPTSFVAGEPTLSAILRGDPVTVGLEPSTALRHALSALWQQGCFRFRSPEQLSRHQLFEAFEPLANRWYATYFDHPIWGRLETGKASKGELLGWVLHNYHVSRSAGGTDARCAVARGDQAARSRFAENAIDEYAHCDDYFFVRHPRFAVPDEQVKRAVHSPGSLAFDQNMLRLAERDCVAHALVSFFQENSIQFYGDIVTFYKRIEDAYGLDAFFEPWVAHMNLDRDGAHAPRLGEFLRSAEMISGADADEAIFGAAVTVHFLLAALDDALEVPLGEPKVRLPVGSGRLCGTLVEAALGDINVEMAARDPVRIARQISALAPSRNPVWRRTESDFLAQTIAECAFRGMSVADGHDEAVAVGRLAECLRERFCAEQSRRAYFGMRPRPWCIAVANLLVETSGRPEVLLGCISYVARRVGAETCGLDAAAIEAYEGLAVKIELGERETERVATRLLQLEELLERDAREGCEGITRLATLM
jgi:hypothetical protein